MSVSVCLFVLLSDDRLYIMLKNACVNVSLLLSTCVQPLRSGYDAFGAADMLSLRRFVDLFSVMTYDYSTGYALTDSHTLVCMFNALLLRGYHFVICLV